MDLKERILAYMREGAYKPLSEEDLGEAMGLTDEELVDFADALEELEKEGAIIKNRSDLYGVPSRMHLAVGRRLSAQDDTADGDLSANQERSSHYGR